MLTNNGIADAEKTKSTEKLSSVASKLQYLYKTLRQLIGTDNYKKLSIFHSL